MRVFCDELTEKLGHGQFLVYVREMATSTANGRFLMDFKFESRLMQLKPDGSPVVLYNNVPAQIDFTMDFQ